MATKTYTGDDSSNANDYSAADNWAPLSIVNSNWQWTASGSGTNEYYLEASGGGDPGIGQPGNVQEDGSNMTSGTAGSLATGEWDWNDNDTLGFNTVYVRLSDGSDPDSKSDGYVTYTQIPQASDDVVIPAGEVDINAGLDQSSVSINSFTVENGYNNDIGADVLNPLQINTSSFDYAGGGTSSIIDLTSSSISPVIRKTGSAATGQSALNLLGTAIGTLNIFSGSVGFGTTPGDTTSEADNFAIGFSDSQEGDVTLRIGSDVTDTAGGSITSIDQGGGTVYNNASVATLNVFAGTYIQRNGTWDDATVHDTATLRWDGTGTSGSTATKIKSGGSFLNNRDLRTKTLSNASVESGATFHDPYKKITYSSAIEFPDGIQDVDLNLGTSIKFTPANI